MDEEIVVGTPGVLPKVRAAVASIPVISESFAATSSIADVTTSSSCQSVADKEQMVCGFEVVVHILMVTTGCRLL